MLYVKPAPVGDVTVMLPVDVEQVGCTVFTIGTAGELGAVFTRAVAGAETHPALFFAVTL
jgi:hypothetical protein